MLQFHSVFLVKVFDVSKRTFYFLIWAAAAAANFSEPYVCIITDILYLDDAEPAQLQLEFKCWLLNSVTGDKVPVSISRPICPETYIHQKCTCT